MTAKKDKNPDGLPPARLLKKLLQEQPTPFYLYDAEGFRKACMDLRLVFSWNDGFELCFPARMNPNPAILRVLADAGVYKQTKEGREGLMRFIDAWKEEVRHGS